MRYSALLDRRVLLKVSRDPQWIDPDAAPTYTRSRENRFPPFSRVHGTSGHRARWWRKTVVRQSNTVGWNERRWRTIPVAMVEKRILYKHSVSVLVEPERKKRNLPIVMLLQSICSPCVVWLATLLLRGKRCYMQNNPVQASCDVVICKRK